MYRFILHPTGFGAPAGQPGPIGVNGDQNIVISFLSVNFRHSDESPGVDNLLIQNSVLDTGAAMSPHPGISLLGLIIS